MANDFFYKLLKVVFVRIIDFKVEDIQIEFEKNVLLDKEKETKLKESPNSSINIKNLIKKTYISSGLFNQKSNMDLPMKNGLKRL